VKIETELNRPERLVGYDLARAFAILGMVLVHFCLAMSSKQPHIGLLGGIFDFLDGRAAATFLALAGCGLTLLSRRAVASRNPPELAAARAMVVRRGLFLLVCGFLNLTIWQGDILRVYGVSFIIAAAFLEAPTRRLWQLAAFFGVGFIPLMALFNYDKNWDWNTLTYHRLWTAEGAFRNLFFDGFRSVFPWTGLIFFGMGLGRLDLRQIHVRRSVVIWGVSLLVTAKLLSILLVARFTKSPSGLKPEEIKAFFGLDSMPPLPIYLSSAVGAAMLVIGVSFVIVERWGNRALVRALISTGQMAFTWYIGHIVIGLGVVVALGWTDNRPLWQAYLSGASFFAVAMCVSTLWKRHFKAGPLEALMRYCTGHQQSKPS
jgi:uncharacterized protein